LRIALGFARIAPCSAFPTEARADKALEAMGATYCRRMRIARS
jgi:hypothetical protein